MGERGYLLLVLNTHLPFVRHPEIEYPQEENWLFEAITDCYIPLIEVFKGLIIDDVNFKTTFSLNPCLIEMLSDTLLQKRYIRYIEERTQLAEKECERLRDNKALHKLTNIWYSKFLRVKKVFVEDFNQNIISEIKSLKDSGKIEIITSGATHAFFPLWELYPQIVDLQIQLGIRQYENYFDSKPLGFWLPECGFSHNFDKLLQKNGIKYFFSEKHGITNGYPKPKFGEYAPIHCPSGVATFARDWASHDIVWLKDKGYPGDPHYLNYDKDIGFELSQDYLFPFTHQKNSIKTGIKYLCNGFAGIHQTYDPDIAFKRCDEHSNNFIERCHQQIKNLSAQMERKPVIVALFDTEHFGHWWYEGPIWLNLLLRKLAYDQKEIKLITALDYLKMYPTNQVVTPSLSSWGWQGYSETWLMGRNHWIYPPLYEAIEHLDKLIETNHSSQTQYRIAFNQYLRELLLAQASDWPYMMWAQTTQEYAENRVRYHLDNMTRIHQQIEQGNIDTKWLKSIQEKNNIFSDMGLFDIYRNILYSYKDTYR